MSAPVNTFKHNIQRGIPQLGCWIAMGDAYVAEMTATAGFDWLLIDGEHAPNDIRSISAQVTAVRPSAHPVVRLPIGETWMIKQVLDLGVQTILVPMVESAEQARELVQAVHYPPVGKRGVGAALVRASGFASIPDYLQTADDEICLLVQVENRSGLNALDDILQVDGIAGVFVGPSDLAADMGYLGQASHPDVVQAVTDALTRIKASGKAPGILTMDLKFAKRCLDLGVLFLATGADVVTFTGAMRTLAQDSRDLLK